MYCAEIASRQCGTEFEFEFAVAVAVEIEVAFSLEQNVQAAAACESSHNTGTDSTCAGSTPTLVTARRVLLRRVTLLRILHRTLAIVTTLLLLGISAVSLLLRRVSLLLLVVAALLLAIVVVVRSARAWTRGVLVEVTGVCRSLVGWRRTCRLVIVRHGYG